MRRNKRFPKGNLGAGGIHSRRASEIETGFPKKLRKTLIVLRSLIFLKVVSIGEPPRSAVKLFC